MKRICQKKVKVVCFLGFNILRKIMNPIIYVPSVKNWGPEKITQKQKQKTKKRTKNIVHRYLGVNWHNNPQNTSNVA
jgi:hypothetical protein